MNANRTEDLVSRLRRQWIAWGSPTDRDKCLSETGMAMDCKEAADEIERLQRWAAKAGHCPECAYWKPWTNKGCTCGLVDLMLGLPEEPTRPLITPLEQLLVEWWSTEMENAELFNRAVRVSPALAVAMSALPEKSG
jgi:hypothetical protein